MRATTIAPNGRIANAPPVGSLRPPDRIGAPTLVPPVNAVPSAPSTLTYLLRISSHLVASARANPRNCPNQSAMDGCRLPPASKGVLLPKGEAARRIAARVGACGSGLPPP